MTNTGSAPAGQQPASAAGKMRPAPQAQFRLMPVPLPRAVPMAAEWNDLVSRFIAS